MTNKTRRLITTVLLVFLLAVSSAEGARIEGVLFDDTVQIDQTRFYLQGTALLRYMVVLKGYVGAFYLPENIDPRRALEDVPRHLVLEYFHAISAVQFAKATRVTIAENLTAEERRRLAPAIDRLADAYRDVSPKDRYALTYFPGQGTRLSLNDKTLTVIPGADFSRAVFSIWIGPHPIDRSFRDRVLGIDGR